MNTLPLITAATGLVAGWFLGRRPLHQTANPARWLETHHRVALELSREGNIENTLPEVLRVICDNLGWSHGGYWKVDPRETLLKCPYAHAAPGFSNVFKDDALKRTFELGVGLPGRALKSGLLERIEDVTTDPNFPRYLLARDLGLRGAVGIPVTAAGKTLGVLEFIGPELEPLDRVKEFFYKSIGEQVGQYLLRKEAEEGLVAGERRWMFALESSGDGVWDWKLPTGDVWFSDQWKKMLGFAPDEVAHELDSWKNLVHPDDIHWVIEEVQKHIRGETPQYITTHRVRCKDGSYKWILDRGKVVEWTRDGQPFRMIGTHTDIDNPMMVPQAPPPILPDKPPEPGRHLNVLVVDDDEDSLRLITVFVEPLGANVETARNGQEAFDKVTAGSYDLVLMDVQMPVMDGLTATRRIREHESRHKLAPVPIVAVTARAYIKDYEESVTAGCNTHVAKPLQRESFQKTLRPFFTRAPS
ncbi:MAG: response regulator [Planctomycetota bacterium]